MHNDVERKGNGGSERWGPPFGDPHVRGILSTRVLFTSYEVVLVVCPTSRCYVVGQTTVGSQLSTFAYFR